MADDSDEIETVLATADTVLVPVQTYIHTPDQLIRHACLPVEGDERVEED